MDNLSSLIRNRQSSRVLFDPNRPVPAEDLRQILDAGSWAPTAHNMQNFEVVIVDDQTLIQEIAAVRAPVSVQFVRENFKQLSFSEAELLAKKTGVLGSIFPAAWQKPHIRKADIVESDKSAFMQQELHSTPVLGIVLYDPARRAPASKGDFLGIISLGCVMENMWLMANHLGIQFHILSALSNKPVAKAIRRILHIPKRLEIAYAFRLGYAIHDGSYLRVRRNIPDFTHHNRYGRMGI